VSSRWRPVLAVCPVAPAKAAMAVTTQRSSVRVCWAHAACSYRVRVGAGGMHSA